MNSIEQTPDETLIYDPERRLYDDTTTWLAEALDGHLHTLFEYRFDGRELYGRDGSPLKPIFTEAVAAAEKLGPNLAFEARRRQIELEEYEEMIAMTRGEMANTMVVISDFPAELFDASSDVGGYNILRKQTMLRVIYRTGEGTLRMVSQSLDGSERNALEAIYRALNHRAQPGELLGQRIHIDLERQDQTRLADYLTGVYDRHLTHKFGGAWHAGRPAGGTLDTYEFVCGQADLMQAFSHRIQINREEDHVVLYDLAAAMSYRFNLLRGQPPRQTFQADQASVEGALLIMHEAGQKARSGNQTYSGCGISLGPTGVNTEAELSENGYGNKTSEKTEYKFDKYMHCVVCQAPPKTGEARKMCGPCGICRSCDQRLKSKM